MGDPAIDSQVVVGMLKSMVEKLPILASLTQFGVTVTALDDLVEAAFCVRRLHDNSPMDLDRNDIRAIYAKVV